MNLQLIPSIAPQGHLRRAGQTRFSLSQDRILGYMKSSQWDFSPIEDFQTALSEAAEGKHPRRFKVPQVAAHRVYSRVQGERGRFLGMAFPRIIGGKPHLMVIKKQRLTGGKMWRQRFYVETDVDFTPLEGVQILASKPQITRS